MSSWPCPFPCMCTCNVSKPSFHMVEHHIVNVPKIILFANALYVIAVLNDFLFVISLIEMTGYVTSVFPCKMSAKKNIYFDVDLTVPNIVQ